MKKKLLITVCIISLMLMNISINASAENRNITMENIEELVLAHNLDIKIESNNLKSKIKYYDELDDEINELETKISNNRHKADNSQDDEEKSKIRAQIALDEVTLDEKKEEYDDRKNVLKKLRMEYNEKVKQAVVSAQNKYVDYLASMAAREIKEDEFKYYNEKNKIQEAKYNMGYLARNSYNNDFVDLDESKKAYQQALNDENIKQKELKKALGLSDNEKIEIKDNFEFELDRIANINFENDYNEMINNNIEIKIKKIELDQIEDEDNEKDSEKYLEENAELSLQQTREDIKLTLEKTYNDLIDSYNSIKVHKNKLTKSENDYEIMKIKLSFGELSKKEVEKQKIDLDNTKKDFNKERNELYMSYMKYLQVKEGYILN